MLAEIDQIDWKSYGAENIPYLIWGLASPNWDVGIEAYNELESILVPSAIGDPLNYDISAIQNLLSIELPVLIVPFLIEVVQAENGEMKSAILQLLLDMSNYVHLEIETELSQKRARQVFEAVKEGIETYQILLHDRSSAVKMNALLLIEHLGVKPRLPPPDPSRFLSDNQ